MAQGGRMTIEHEMIGKSTVVLSLNGRLDTANAPLLERKIKQWGNEITELVLDFSELSYISSMGLRVLLQAKKSFKEEGRKLIIKNMGDSIREVFEMTGFLHLMVAEEKFVVIRKHEGDDIVLSLNGQMEDENVEMVEKELSEIKQTHYMSGKPVTVIFDLENLTYISSTAGKLLKDAAAHTKWNHRQLHARNASVDIQAALHDSDLGYIL